MTESVPLDSIHPDPANVRLHPARNLDQIKSSLIRFGQQKPLVVDRKGVIRAGNGTWEAAKALGWTEIEIRRTDLEGAEATAYAIADNRSTETSLFDPEALDRTLKALAAEGAGLDESWFSTDEIAGLLASVTQAPPTYGDPDAVPEPPAEPVSRRGGLWLCGQHRVLCGSAADDQDVSHLLQGEAVGVLFTDPPYGINRDPAWLDGVGTHRRALSSRDTLAGDDGSLDLSFLWEFKRRMVWGFPYIFDPLATGWIVWDKQPGVESRGIVTPIEMAATTLRKGFDMVRCMWGGYYRAAGESREAHPTQKPVKVIAPFLESWTSEGEIIYDPFAGSGSTLAAAEGLGRITYLMEIEPKYVDLICDRYSRLTHTDPVHADGRKWSEMKADRIAMPA